MAKLKTKGVVKKEFEFTSFHVGVSAEAISAALFARFGYDVSVQYGANQPEYDLIISRGEKLLKVSVKGTKEHGWGLCQSYLSKENETYHDAIDAWEKDHNRGTIFCFVSFRNVPPQDMPRVYLATPIEVAKRLHATRSGGGYTVLFENKIWTARGKGAGTIDSIPEEWKISENRIEELF